jgi:hypothetical protein
MKSLLTMAVLAATLFAARSASAQTFYMTHGSSCFPINGSQVGYNQYGVYASTTAPAYVNCPLTMPNWMSNYSAGWGIEGYDRSSTDDLTCTLTDITYLGNVAFQSTLSTSGYSGSSLSATGTITTAQYPWLTCKIPGYSSSYGYSHLTVIYIDY